MDRIIIVDENDNEIGVKERNEVLNSDIYRVSSLWIQNTKGEILLAKRALTKKNDPGKWGPAVAGTVEEHESYEQNIIKEAEEELGLENIKPEKGVKAFHDGKHRFWSQRFLATVDLDTTQFKVQEDEVAEIGWFSVEGLLKDLAENPDNYIPSFPNSLKQYLLK